MHDILKQIYDGSLNPSQKYTGNDKRYEEKTESINEYEEKINALLSDEGKELFKELNNAHWDINGITNADKFVVGFRMGARIMLEVFYGAKC